MRRRLEKWSQGWVSSRQQPRQSGRTNSIRSDVGPSTGQFFELGSETTSPATSPTAGLLFAEDEKGLFDRSLEADPFATDREVSMEDAACEPQVVLQMPEVFCHHAETSTLSTQDAGPLPIRCTLRLTNEALFLESQPAPPVELWLDKVTDVTLSLRMGEEKPLEEEDRSFVLAAPVSPTSETDTQDPGSDVMEDMEMPPIPFGQLPSSEPGLRARWKLPPKVPIGCWLAERPLAEFDSSNILPQQLLSMSIPPLRPSDARLPKPPWRLPGRTDSEIDAWVSQALRSAASGELLAESAVIVWASSTEVAKCSGRACRLQKEGLPTVIFVKDDEEARYLREELLRCRAGKL